MRAWRSSFIYGYLTTSARGGMCMQMFLRRNVLIFAKWALVLLQAMYKKMLFSIDDYCSVL